MDELSESEIKQLASQLRTPEGSAGIDVGHTMHETNINMTMTAAEALNLCEGDAMLEVGHGNGAHVEQILDLANNLQYVGLDISETMHQEARRLNKAFIDSGQASFHLYDGHTFPFPDSHFDKMLTVNTIYFWEDPRAMLEETHRVLTAEGLFGISFAQKSFMEELPFAKYGFQLYNTDDIKTLAEQSQFQINDLQNQTERVESKDGTSVERKFTIITLKG